MPGFSSEPGSSWASACKIALLVQMMEILIYAYIHPALVRYQMQSDALLLVRCRKRVWSVPAPWPERTGPDTEHVIFRIGPEIQPRRSPRVGVGKNRTSGRARKAEEGEEAGIQKLRYRTGNAVPLRAGQPNPIKARNRSPSASPVPDAVGRTSFGPMPKTRLVGAGAGPGVAATDRTRHGACHLPHWPGNPTQEKSKSWSWEEPDKRKSKKGGRRGGGGYSKATVPDRERGSVASWPNKPNQSSESFTQR